MFPRVQTRAKLGCALIMNIKHCYQIQWTLPTGGREHCPEGRGSVRMGANPRLLIRIIFNSISYCAIKFSPEAMIKRDVSHRKWAYCFKNCLPQLYSSLAGSGTHGYPYNIKDHDYKLLLQTSYTFSGWQKFFFAHCLFLFIQVLCEPNKALFQLSGK
jgi:hypothetical protein